MMGRAGRQGCARTVHEKKNKNRPSEKHDRFVVAAGPCQKDLVSACAVQYGKVKTCRTDSRKLAKEQATVPAYILSRWVSLPEEKGQDLCVFRSVFSVVISITKKALWPAAHEGEKTQHSMHATTNGRHSLL
jgi:hypothetical protein